LQAESSSLQKGESLLDTLRTLDAMKPDCIVMRHRSSGAADFVARHLEIPVLNAGDGTHEHPTQALLDALTIRDRLGHLDGWNVSIIGDILHSRVARSNIHLLSKFGSRITLCGPPMWVPPEMERMAGGEPLRRVARVEEALDGADIVHVLRVQQERLHEPKLPLDEYVMLYQLTPDRLRLARPGALVLHPGPMIRGLEIDPAVADGPQSCVLEQVTNGLAVRMALLFLLADQGRPPARSGQRDGCPARHPPRWRSHRRCRSARNHRRAQW
jgi:aspartate carbamoyltransferase catalytic subunit